MPSITAPAQPNLTIVDEPRRGRKDRVLATAEQRDLLLNVIYGHDQEPARCADHSDAKTTRKTCEACRLYDNWRMRMYHRFHSRGLQLTFDPHAYEDPEPVCAAGHYDPSTNGKTCDDCRLRNNWRERQYQKMRRDGIERTFTDWDTLRAHLAALRAAGMLATDIAKASGVGASTIQHLFNPGGDRRYVRRDVASKLLAVPVPDRKITLVPDVLGAVRRRVDATGTRRRIQALCVAGYTMRAIARHIGWSEHTIPGWIVDQYVATHIADSVAAAFPRLIVRPGGNTAAASWSLRKGWIAARYFDATNIDDPAYDPFKLSNNPCGVYRMLRALAWMGHGPEQVAEHIGEPADQIQLWLKAAPAPAYAHHMVAAAFDDLGGDFGPDATIAAEARRLHWAPPLAWYGINLANPLARPHVGLPPGERVNAHPLDSQVHFALAGLAAWGELLPQEKTRVVWALHKAGWSDRRIAVWLRCNNDDDKGRDIILAFRSRNHIVGYGVPSGRETQHDAVAA